MYMKNGRRRWEIDGLPPGYSGQYRDDAPEAPAAGSRSAREPEIRAAFAPERSSEGEREGRGEEPKEERREEGEDKKEKKGGFLSGIGGRIGRILSGKWELEDLILLGVLFFMLKDGADEDILLIIAIILFAS